MAKSEIERQPKNVQMMITAGTDYNYFGVNVSIIGVFVNGKLVEHRVWKTESL